MSWPNWLPLRETLRPMSPYGAPQVPAQASLNTNENPYSPSPALQKAISDAVASVAADYRAAPSEDDYATYWDNIANAAAAELDAIRYDDDHYEEFSFSDRYHDDEESLWSDDDAGR